MRCLVVIGFVLGCFVASSAPAQQRKNPAPAKGAQYTIFCTRIEGDLHVERANRLKNELTYKSGMNGWHLVHEDRQSLLYYGSYSAFNDLNDEKETIRAQTDLKRIKSLTSEGTRLFSGAIFVDLQSPDPVAPPEWNLLNAKGAWSIQIGAYNDSPLRKDAAVEAVREARKQGIEAYYYHGDAVSSVCIGAWPAEAVRIEADTKDQINTTDSVLVAPAAMPDVSGVLGEQDVKVIKERVTVVDQTMMALMKQYPFHAVNGMQIVRNVNGRDVPDPSLLIKIPQPKEQSAGLADGTPSTEPGAAQGYPITDEPSNSSGPKPVPADTGLGKLKSVGDK